MENIKTPLLIAVVLLVIAVFPMPYGYYQFLRIAITIVAGITALTLFASKNKLLITLFVALAILYNPILTIHFNKATWMPINIITALVFGAFALISKKDKTT